MFLEDLRLILFKSKWYIITTYECCLKYNAANRKRLAQTICSIFVIMLFTPFLVALTAYKTEENVEMVAIIEPEIIEEIIIEEKEPEYIATEQIILELKPTIQPSLLKKIATNVNYYESIIDREYFITLISTESEFNPYAVSYTGAWNGTGLCQISQPGLDDYNSKHNTNYIRDDLYNVDINMMIAAWMYMYNKEVYTSASDHRELYVVYNIGSGTYNKYGNYYMNGTTEDLNNYTSLSRYDNHYRMVLSAFNNIN
jgi:hypothetical protein